MTGESDLSTLLVTLTPELRPGRYVFSTVPDWAGTHGLEVLASVLEPEGLSLVLSQHQADQAGLSYDYVAGWITLNVQSALEAVGLTAAVSTALADIGVSCNVLAGYHHDHLLVPLSRAAEAVQTLQQLSLSAGQTQRP